MRFYDTHMHSHLSFDCFENPTQYITDKTEVLTFTEHLDLENTANHGQDDIPDFATTLQWRQEFQKAYNVELLLGVEIGYVPSHLNRLNSILADYHFDLKLLSVHQNDAYDYMDDTVRETPEHMIHRYLDQLLLALTDMPECQIMTHFDYGFRIHEVSEEDMGQYEDKLMQIFKQCIDNGMAFELNSKSIINYNKKWLYEWAIPRYQALGGNLFSLGSDAHKVEEHFMNFNDLIDLLEKFGVTEVAQFYQQKLTMLPLNTVKQIL